MHTLDFSEALISNFPVTIRRRVAGGDCDPAGIVYTPRFSDYAMSARDWFMRIGLGILDRPHPARTGIGYPMRAISFDFRSMLAADDLFDMATTVEAISNRTFTIKITATRVEDGSATDIPAFIVMLTGIAVDSADGQAVTLPDATREALEKYLTAQHPAQQ